ncbi:DUF6093 family protein [Streptomyces decoyicus]|uniref:DUF6093 family protein n=1 Tax=Streptomyces decoyicus TaxID=249567 RepID=UPI002E19C7DC
MSAASAAAAGQAAALALMEDMCRIERAGAVVTTEDGQDTTAPQVLYEGPCRIKPVSTATQTSSSPNAPADTWQYKVTIPPGGAAFTSGDAVVFVVSRDAYLVGKRMRIRNVEGGTHVTARRFWCTEVAR